MRCPKCGYTSFDYLDECKKCGKDLRDVRSMLQIITVSPDDRAPKAPAGAEADDMGLPPPMIDNESPEVLGLEQPEEGEMLGDLNFDESFDDLVEPTGYGTVPDADKPAPTELPTEDDELLDLDFGDLFGDGDSKTN